MNRELLTPQNVLVQGITGTHGAFHTAAMLSAGTNVVAGTSPNKAGQSVMGVPVYGSVRDAAAMHRIDASVIFVPAPFAKSAMIEAIESGVPLVACITEGVPVHDMMQVAQRARAAGTVIIGPNCPGVLLPGIVKLGIIPADLAMPGDVAIVGRSGTLTYEIMAGLSASGIGQRYVIGIGGDRMSGVDFVDCLELFQQDAGVGRIVLIGEIGGLAEKRAAEYIASNITKPVHAYVAGHQAPLGVQMGHAGAILGSDQESADAKTAALKSAGAIVADSPTAIVSLIKAA